MSDTQGPDEPGQEPTSEGWGASPPPPPAGPPPTEPPLSLDSETEISSGGISGGGSGIGGRVAAGIIGVLLLVGGSLFAVTQLGSSGPDSAEEAVSALVEAAGDEDVLGVLAALDPGERDVLRDSVEETFGELERLEVVDDSLELTGVPGVDLVFSDVTYRTEPVRDGLARVYFTGGTVTTGYNTDDLPIGDFIHDTVERFGGDISGQQDSETEELDDDDDTFLVAREGSDGWRVSIGYTLAEAARMDSGQPVPTEPIEPVGADSPEAAVEGMAHAIADLDLRSVLARLSPDEFAALQEYAGLFIDEAEAELDAARSEVDITLDDLELRADTSGDRASVFVESLALTANSADGRFSFSTDGECFTIDGDVDELGLAGTPFANGEVCPGDVEDMGAEMFGGAGPGGMFGGMFEGIEMPEFPEFELPEIGISTTRVDGEWYVAPIATTMDAQVALLRSLDRAHLDALAELAENLYEAFLGGFGAGEFEAIETVPEPMPDQAPPTTALGGTLPTEPPGPIDVAALEEFTSQFAFDEAALDCILAELEAAGPYVQWEIADSYVNDYIPSTPTQDAFFAAMDACA